MKRISSFFVFLAVIALVIGSIGCAKGAKRTTPAEPTSSPTGSKQRAITFDLCEVLSIYKDNPVAARIKYEGELFVIKGRVIKIYDDWSDYHAPMVYVDNENWESCSFYNYVYCIFNQNRNEVARLHRGESITFKGKLECIKGRGIFHFTDCYVSEILPEGKDDQSTGGHQ